MLKRSWGPLRNIQLRRCLATTTARDVGKSPNGELIQFLEQDLNEERVKAEDERNQFRVRAFQLAIKAIGQLDQSITSSAEIKNIKGIGPGITRRVSDFLGEEQDYLQTPIPQKKRKAREVDPNLRIRQELTQISGIGARNANILIADGCTSIEMLREPRYLSKLSHAQQISVLYHEHLKHPVPREDANDAFNAIRKCLPSQYDMIMCGDFRRGFPVAQEIDILLTHTSHVKVPIPKVPSPYSKATRMPKSKSGGWRETPLTHEAIPVLTERGLLAQCLFQGSQQWQGFVRIPDMEETNKERRDAVAKIEGTFRRLDLNLVPLRSKGAALLALSGDEEFVQETRLRAQRMGMHLNEYGLWRWMSVPPPDGDSSNGFWELLPSTTEEEILAELEMEFVPPERRNYSYLKPRTKVGRVVASRNFVDIVNTPQSNSRRK